jgi:hypothetical protein
MNETPKSWFKQLIILLMGSLGFLSITQALNGVNTKEVLRMIIIAAQWAIIIGGMAWMRLNSLTRVKKVYAGNRIKLARFDMIFLGGLSLLQHNDQTQIPTTTVVLVIAFILFLFIVCPYLIGRILSQPEWTEEEAMEAELPQWDDSDNWADLFPRYLPVDVDDRDRSEVSHKK